MSKRREFIKTIGALGIGATIPTLLTQSCANQVYNGTITLLQTTDVHCQIHPHDELFWENDKMVFRKTGGYAQIATAFDELRQQNPNTFIVDTGDMFQGSELAVKTTGKALIPILNSLDYNLYLPGNWEVVYGKWNMERLMYGLNAPKICANMFHDGGMGQCGDLIFAPYYVYKALGQKIGFLGYTDPLVPVRQSPAYSKGIVYTKPEETLAEYIKILKEKEQCTYIIVLAHLGLSQQISLANNPDCQGIDYIFGGDTHERVRKPIQCKFSKVVEPGAFGSFIGKLNLQVNDNQIVSDSYELMEVSSDKYKPKTSIYHYINLLEKPFLQDINKIIGYSSVPLYRYFVIENTMDTLIVEALKWEIGTDIALSKGFRFCPPVCPIPVG